MSDTVTRMPCPTCSGPIRETVGMVCQTCGTDYGPKVDAGTWHSEIMQAGVDGLHRLPGADLDGEDHQDCRDIVFAILTGLADAGYRLVKP